MKNGIPDFAPRAFPPRPDGLHKYTAGTVLVAGGSRLYANAPAMAALGARAAGAGLVHLAAPEQSRAAAAALVPEATFRNLPPDDAPPRADAVAAGMGLGTSPGAERVLSELLSCGAENFVIDADALAILARWRAAGRDFTQGWKLRITVTPHAGEAAAMLGCTPGDVEADRMAAALELRRLYRATVVLKGPGTIVAPSGGGEPYTCPAGNPFMASGGMGDILAGAIAARWARMARADPAGSVEETAWLAAASAAWLHSAAADSLVAEDPPEEPCAANMARRMASMRIALESGKA